MSLAGNQQRIFLELLAALRSHWHRDRNLPARIQSLLAQRRSFGSRDRRLYRELCYTTLRFLPWIEPHLDRDPAEAVRRVAWLSADTAATAGFRAAFPVGDPPAGDRAELLPAWFRAHCPEAFAPEQIDALLARAPLWLRFQTDAPQVVTAEFAALGWRFAASPVLLTALRLLDEVDVTQTRAYADGLIEIQDLGSQCVLESAAIAPGEHWLDACAGAGGKSLQLARLLGPVGHVDAHDVRPAALRELAARATRAGIGNISIFPHPPRAAYDGVLVDTPCSGSGTWRRAPHLKWVTHETDLAAAANRQRELVAGFSARVRPGGRLIYATCSLSRMENEDVVAAFLGAHPGFVAELPARDFGGIVRGGGVTFLPATHDTDGFFVAALRRT